RMVPVASCEPPLRPQFGRGHGPEVVTEGRFCVHEIAHHFGIDDERLHALGYG
ncbi:metallopeptidase family protein, partial [Streptomyces sp. NPDC056084]|uniref:metallopeptidase family protein n=1 Tax=Streptomyces sp. NPDC056084 TaxID=3345707 RepID=UPI0035D631F7